MPNVVLAPALARWLKAHPGQGATPVTVSVDGATVREVLAGLFAIHPAIRGYIVDERGALRHHVVAYLDGEAVSDKETLVSPVRPDSELYIFQALSGG
jgi:hypothetical protein